MSVESSAGVQCADAAAEMTMMQQMNTNGGHVQPFQMGVDSWFTEYAQALQMAKDIEGLMKRNKLMVSLKKVNMNYERNLTLVLISQRVTKLWQILDRLDALGKNPDRTRISELEQNHRQKLVREERCRIMQKFMDFQEYHALTGQAPRSEITTNGEPDCEERFRAKYCSEPDGRFKANYCIGLGELLYNDQRRRDPRVKGVTSVGGTSGTKTMNHSEPSGFQSD